MKYKDERDFYSENIAQISADPVVLFCVSVNPIFCENVRKMRKDRGIDVKVLREKLKSFGFGVDLYTKALEYTHNLTTDELNVNGFKDWKIGTNITGKSRNIDFDRMMRETPLLRGFEQKYLPKQMLSAFLHTYHLSERYSRRIASIILYDDFPKLDDCISYPKKQSYVMKSKSHNQEKRAEFRKGYGYIHYPELLPKTTTDADYMEIRIYGDTEIDCLALPKYLSYLKKLQKVLPDFRYASLSKKRNLDRDATFYYLRKKEGLSYKEANKALEDRYGFEPYTNHRQAYDDIKRFDKYARDESKNRKPHNVEFDLSTLSKR